MKLNHKLIRRAAITATSIFLTFAPLAIERQVGMNIAHAQNAQESAANYNPNTNPFVAGSGIKAMAEKAGSAKELHAILQSKLTASSSGKTLRDDRPPRTAEVTLKKGGDCTEFTYAGIALFKEKGIETGALVISPGKTLRHVLQWAEENGKREIVDPQTKEFGIGRAMFASGKLISFDYEQAVKKLKAQALDANQAAGLYHMEWGNFLKDQKGKEAEAISAFKKAIEINSNDNYSKTQYNALQGKFVNQQMDLGVAAYNSKNIEKALTHFKNALDNFPDNASAKHKAQLIGLIKQCEEILKNQE